MQWMMSGREGLVILKTVVAGLLRLEMKDAVGSGRYTYQCLQHIAVFSSFRDIVAVRSFRVTKSRCGRRAGSLTHCLSRRMAQIELLGDSSIQTLRTDGVS